MNMFQRSAFLVILVIGASLASRDKSQVPAPGDSVQCSALREEVLGLVTDVGAVRETLRDVVSIIDNNTNPNRDVTEENQRQQEILAKIASTENIVAELLVGQRFAVGVGQKSLNEKLVTLLGQVEVLESDRNTGSQKALMRTLTRKVAALLESQTALQGDLRVARQERRDMLDVLQREAEAQTRHRKDREDLGDLIEALQPCLTGVCAQRNP